ncbi:CoA ester lyase [Falsiroseomonas sp.]|uniref:HpcH/HpaI aldolase/citrate lyase family protein n=1 Tax=Falsiroseomonas sp. TaxID=2870721 RepID=UPI0034A32261
MRVKAARSLLFLPATSPHLLPKATERGADALIVDLEDSVPAERKAEARPLAAAALRALAARGAEVLLRVNAEPALHDDDLAVLPRHVPVTVMLPKVEDAAQVEALVAKLAGLGLASPVAALVETPRGALEAPRIAAAPGVCAVGFGAEDFAASVGLAPSPAALAMPAQLVGLAAHAHGHAFWGLASSVAETVDMEAFGALVRLSRQLGFTGSVCIHPRQVPVVNAGFGPTPDEIAWARRAVAAAEEARARDEGAVLLDGRMIDRPIEDRARRWLAL